jgi:hypothetical protein
MGLDMMHRRNVRLIDFIIKAIVYFVVSDVSLQVSILHVIYG